MLSKIVFCSRTIGQVFLLLAERIVDTFRAYVHLFTYRASTNAKTVLVIGGSYAGYTCAEHLARNLPSGWRVQLVEKNSHFNHTWLFPRISVTDRHHELAFIPYPDKPSLTPEGAFELVKARVEAVRNNHVILDNGSKLSFEYLILATGLPGRYPVGIDDLQKGDSLQFFERYQEKVKRARSLIVVGGGPVGIEIALDAKFEFPDKEITLIHSRDRLAQKYHQGVHDECMRELKKSNIRVILGERVTSGFPDATYVTLSTGEVLTAEYVIVCTGASREANPISFVDIVHTCSTGLIKVNQYLQVSEPATNCLFAIGDVADTETKKTGRAAAYQGLVAAKNIIRKINGISMKRYCPGVIEESLDLSLGLNHHLIHIGGKEAHLQFMSKTKDETLSAWQLWCMLRQTPPITAIKK